MISKLPELAVEEAGKKEDAEERVVKENIVEEIKSVDPENDIIEFIEDTDDSVDVIDFAEEIPEEEEVIKTTLPYDFFEESSSLEFVEENNSDEEASDEIADFDAVNDVQSEEVAEENEDLIPESLTDEVNEIVEEVADIPISKAFTVNTLNEEDNISVSAETDDSPNSIFSSFQTIEEEEDIVIAEEPKKKKGFFRRK